MFVIGTCKYTLHFPEWSLPHCRVPLELAPSRMGSQRHCPPMKKKTWWNKDFPVQSADLGSNRNLCSFKWIAERKVSKTPIGKKKLQKRLVNRSTLHLLYTVMAEKNTCSPQRLWSQCHLSDAVYQDKLGWFNGLFFMTGNRPDSRFGLPDTGIRYGRIPKNENGRISGNVKPSTYLFVKKIS
jgi:hypothetical protein